VKPFIPIEERIRDLCCSAFRELYGADLAPPKIGCEKTKQDIEGDLTLVLFPLARYYRKSPEQTGAEVGRFLGERLPEIRKFVVIKGFLNLTLSDDFWINFLSSYYNSPEFGAGVSKKQRPVVLEYSSPNTNKPLHLGHIRNNLLGYSLALILKENGYNVRKVNLINDRGIHICKSLLAYIQWGEGETPQSCGIKGDHLVGKYYVLFEEHLKEEIRSLIETGLTEDEAMKVASLIGQAQDILRQWEARDPVIIRLWQMMNQWAYDGFDQTYRRLGIRFDKVYYESDTYLLGKELVYEGLEKGLLFQKSDGSIWIDLKDEGLDEKLLLRADGTSVYITQDLGTAEKRYEEYHPSKMIYVVGNEQIYHFDVLKKVLKRMGKSSADALYHLSYGMVELPEGKMKSREGKIVDADDLMDEMFLTARETTRELGKVSEMSSEEADTLYNVVGMGALKYFILKVDPKKNMLFDPKESIDFNGNTGPFIQYTYARIQSLLRKAAEAGYQVSVTGWQFPVGSRKSPVTKNISILPDERRIIRSLYQYPSIVKQAAEELSPALIANYIYELAREYNQFNQEVPVLRGESRKTIQFRLILSVFTGSVIKKGMVLLGIDVPERM